MIAPEKVLPPVGYGIGEVEKILGIPTKTGYRLIKTNKLAALEDCTGKLKVSREELYSYMKEVGELD